MTCPFHNKSKILLYKRLNFSFLRNATNVGVNDTADARNVFAAIDFLRSGNSTERPFVIFLPLSLPHPPYRFVTLQRAVYSAGQRLS